MGAKSSKPSEAQFKERGRDRRTRSIHDPAAASERDNFGVWHRYGIDLEDVYEVVGFIGQGHMGEVTKVKRKGGERGAHNEASRNKARTAAMEGGGPPLDPDNNDGTGSVRSLGSGRSGSFRGGGVSRHVRGGTKIKKKLKKMKGKGGGKKGKGNAKVKPKISKERSTSAPTEAIDVPSSKLPPRSPASFASSPDLTKLNSNAAGGGGGKPKPILRVSSYANIAGRGGLLAALDQSNAGSTHGASSSIDGASSIMTSATDEGSSEPARAAKSTTTAPRKEEEGETSTAAETTGGDEDNSDLDSDESEDEDDDSDSSSDGDSDDDEDDWDEGAVSRWSSRMKGRREVSRVIKREDSGGAASSEGGAASSDNGGEERASFGMSASAPHIDLTSSAGRNRSGRNLQGGGGRRIRFERLYACKTVLTTHVKKGYLEQLLNEITVMRTLDHPYILQLFEVYQVKRKIWLITELCTGGDLTSRKLSERQSTVVIEQILQALTYMHRHGILHRDVKLENILYKHNGKDSTIRLIDFGLSKTFDRGEKTRQAVAAAYALSPEMAQGKKGEYTAKTDIWGVGVVAWILLAGDFPFVKTEEDLKDKEKLNKLLNAAYRFGITWKGRNISQDAKSFVAKCLKKKPEDRWTAKEALKFVQETWMPNLEASKKKEKNGGGSDHDSPEYCKMSRNVETTGVKVEDVSRFGTYGRLKKTVLMAMAHTMERDDVEGLRQIFFAADTTNAGTISLTELKGAFVKLHPDLTDEEMEAIFRGIDHDRSGQIHWAEFVAALSESYGLVTMDRLAEAFDRLDAEGKGYISHDDLKRLLGKDYDTQIVDDMIKEADFKQNGQVDYEELLRLMFENPTTGMEAVGDVGEALRVAGMEDIGTPSLPPSRRATMEMNDADES